MKTTDILSRVSAELRAEAEQHANAFGATRTICGKIQLFREPGLIDLADTRVPRWNGRHGVYIEVLAHEKRVQNLAERLVVAVRIQQARSKRLRTH